METQRVLAPDHAPARTAAVAGVNAARRLLPGDAGAPLLPVRRRRRASTRCCAAARRPASNGGGRRQPLLLSREGREADDGRGRRRPRRPGPRSSREPPPRVVAGTSAGRRGHPLENESASLPRLLKGVVDRPSCRPSPRHATPNRRWAQGFSLVCSHLVGSNFRSHLALTILTYLYTCFLFRHTHFL